MNHYQKLEAAINAVLNLSFKEQDNFFVNEVVPKLQVVRDLLYFPNIDNIGFKQYLALFQNDVQIDINRCICSMENTIELTELLQNIKSHIKPKLQVVEYAFSYYLRDSAPLFKKLDKSKIIQFRTKRKGLHVSTTNVID